MKQLHTKFLLPNRISQRVIDIMIIKISIIWGRRDLVWVMYQNNLVMGQRVSPSIVYEVLTKRKQRQML